MSCYHPIFGIRTGLINPDTGKERIRIVDPYTCSQAPKDRQLQLPCGRCVGCRLDKSREWANRGMLELKYHDSAYFCTFTYDDAHVPVGYAVDPLTGEAFPAQTLVPRDFTLLMKRIRRRFESDTIRFLGCGEYGRESMRPHYHAILYGLHLNDLEFYKQNFQGDVYYNSPSLSSCWCDSNGVDIGYVVVAPVTWETIAYVARYNVKKRHNFSADEYRKLGMEPEFVRMSRRPGLGRQYFDDHEDEIFKYEFINLSTEKKGLKFRPPKYFERLYEERHPHALDALKKTRQEIGEASFNTKMAQTSLNGSELLSLAETVKEKQIKSLRRNKV